MDKSPADWEKIEKIIAEIVGAQQGKVLQCGRRIIPTLTPEDMLQPNDYIELELHPHFRYEEGLLGGIQTVQMALWALRKEEAQKTE
jgi:hypothetical protein